MLATFVLHLVLKITLYIYLYMDIAQYFLLKYELL